MPLSLYVHIPFCSSKCPYCDFTSGYKPDKEQVRLYTAALCKELELFASDHPEKNSLSTVYIGGGTPSLLPVEELENIWNAIRRNYSVHSAESTIEANPDDVTGDKALAWKKMGFDRVSLGVQSMEDTVLKILGRKNTVRQNGNAVEALRQSGFGNISVDWIAGVKGENNERNIGEMLSLEPEHFSVYQLTLEEKTLLHRKAMNGKYKALTDDKMMESHWKIAGVLEQKGYARYEVSNFALPGFESRHNGNYWDYGEYIGIGLGASGFTRGGSGAFGRRWTNHTNFKEYFSAIDRGELPAGFTEDIDTKTAYREFVMLAMRKKEGIRYQRFYTIFGREFYSVFQEDQIRALEKTVTVDEIGVRLTERGLEILNRVIRDIWDTMM